MAAQPRLLKATPGLLHVSAKEIANLDENGLREVVFRLCRLETALSLGNTSLVLFPEEAKAADDGCDGSTPTNTGSGRWLPAASTCWQLKAGQAGQPSRLKGEITKPLPRKYLLNGGHYVLVASGCEGGESQIQRRLAVLKTEARKAKLPTDKIAVLGAEGLSAWCNDRPTVGRWLLQRGGMASVEEWAADRHHGIPYQDSPARRGQLIALLTYLEPSDAAKTSHVHLHGHPGVGKTRLALEACRSAPWRDAVAYYPEPGADAKALLDQLRSEPASPAVVVVDECRAEHVKVLSASARIAGGRVRLLTIGTEGREVADLVKCLEVGPYQRDEIEAILRQWFPNMARERVEFAAELSDGYVRYARIIGSALDENPNVSVAELVGRPLGHLLDQLLGDLERRHLYVFAVFQSLGWSGDLEDEGRAVAKHLGLDWVAVKATAIQAQRAQGILRTGDRLCYLSPLPLALSLALEAWDLYGEQLRTLPDVLPRESAVRAYQERLEQLGGSPYATQFFRTELERYEKLSDFDTDRAARFWAALAAGEPRGAVSRLRGALERATFDERLAFEGTPRREIMWALPRLAWDAETFEDAVFTLAELAVAENEKWANNATGEFVSRFQIYLGGTVVPYRDRLPVLDVLLNRPDSRYQPLVLAALAKAADPHASRSGGGERHPSKAAGPEWRPGPSEAHECRLQALARLTALIPRLVDTLEDRLLEEFKGFFWPLSRHGHSAQLRELVTAAVQRFPRLREALRKEAAHHIALSKQAGAGEEVPPVLTEIHEALVDSSLEGQLRQRVGPHQWDQDQESQEDFRSLVDAFVGNPDLFGQHVAWLTSGEANAAFQFGWALADRDVETTLVPSMLSRQDRGSDLRMHAGYLLAISKRLGDAWLDKLLESAAAETPADTHLIIEVSSRSVPTERLASLVARLVEQGTISSDAAAPFAQGLWIEGLPLEGFHRLLAAIISSKASRRLGVKMLAYRLKKHPEEREALSESAVILASDPAAVVRHTHEEWLWGEIASGVVERAASQIVRALCELQLTDGFFLQHHDPAERVFLECAELRPVETWEIVSTYLDGPSRPRFVIGFPKAFVGRIPVDLLLTWVANDASRRAAVLAHIVPAHFSADDGIDSQLVERYSDYSAVGGGLFGGLIGGASVGPISQKWGGLADRMEQIATRTRLPRLKAWAKTVAADLREMERRAASAEADEAIRWR